MVRQIMNSANANTFGDIAPSTCFSRKIAFKRYLPFLVNTKNRLSKGYLSHNRLGGHRFPIFSSFYVFEIRTYLNETSLAAFSNEAHT